jgi:exodeoxyribonuclease V alpha subunit
MQEAIRKAAAHLPDALRERMPAEAFTVHRLLGVRRDSREFRHNAENPLPVDLVVVDEASMLDLALATRLLEAVPPSARIMLLGDKDQLAAVESGAVFAELCADPSLSADCIAQLAAATGIPASRIVPAAPTRATSLANSVIWLTDNFRFAGDSGIGQFAGCINRGDADAALALLRARRDAALEWIEDASPLPQPATLARIAAGLAPYLAAARAALDDKPALFDALGRFRVLCAEREGPRGVEAINAYLAQRFREQLDHRLDPGGRSEWYPGRPVMVLANDYVLQLFNGDVGVVLPDASGTLMVHFPMIDGGFRAVAPLRLPRHETAFATTVHKAQGSEFERVLVILPARANRGVTRELLYTAVTRARTAVAIVGGDEVVARAVQSPTQRHSGLITRLAEAV